MHPVVLFQRGCGSLGASTDETYFYADQPLEFSDQRVKGTMRTSAEEDFLCRLKLIQITLVESTYPTRRPECPSLSPHFPLISVKLWRGAGIWLPSIFEHEAHI